MKKVLIILLLISSVASADIWKKMFHVEHVDSSPQAQYDYGFRVGYDEVMNGQAVVVQPSYDAYGQGYVDGRSAAYQDFRRMNGEYQQPVILIDPRETPRRYYR